jgi:hypothetical protein
VPILAPTDLHGLSVLDHLEQELPDVVRVHSRTGNDFLGGHRFRGVREGG